MRSIGRVPKVSPVFLLHLSNRCLECQVACSHTGCSSFHSQGRVRASRSAPGLSAHMVVRCECGAIVSLASRRTVRGVSQSGYDARSTWHVLAGMAWSLATRVRRPAMASVDRSARAALAAYEPQCVR